MAITPTIPDCASAAAGGTAIGDYSQQLYTFFNAQSGDFTLENVVGGPSAVTSFTATHSDGWQINFRVTGGEILTLIDPDGTIADSASPGTPTNASSEVVFVPSPSGTSANCFYAQYGDAILFAIKNSGNTFPIYCSHVGFIAQPHNASDGDIFLDGKGTLGYIPNEQAGSGAGDWGSTIAANSECEIRVAEATWENYTFDSTAAVADTSGNVRFSAMTIFGANGGNPSASADPNIAIFRYLRIDGGADAAPLNVIPSSASNQAFVRINESLNNTRMVALWNKTVTP